MCPMCSALVRVLAFTYVVALAYAVSLAHAAALAHTAALACDTLSLLWLWRDITLALALA